MFSYKEVLFLTLFIIQLIDAVKYGQATTEQCADVVQWIGAQFEFPCKSTKSLFKSSGKFINKNIIATRAQISGDTLFLAFTRLRNGVPATLVKTELKSGKCTPIFNPFPCWDMQQEGDCKALQSVVDLVIDQHEILWVLDTGIVNTLETPIRKCAPKVLAISVKTSKVLKSISLEDLVNNKSRLQYLIIDYDNENNCFIYISDAANRAIIVYNLQADRGFRVVLPKVVSGSQQARDVLYMSLIRKDYGNTELYFTYLSANNLFSLSTDDLRNGLPDGRIKDLGEKPTTLVVLGTDNGQALFMRNEGDTDVFRWDTNTTFSENNFQPVYRSSTCQLATHVLTDYKHNTMQVLQSNFPDFMLNRVGCGATQQLAVMQGCC